MNTVEMLITPEQAKAWLATANTRNRILSTKRAALYAADMINGAWHKTHQGIAFYDDGVLADGQTRLKAIVISNKTIPMQVTFGLQQSASIGIDGHRMRSTANQISIFDQSSWIGKDEIAVARILQRAAGISDNISTTQIIQYCESRKIMIEFAANNLRTKTRNIAPASVKAAVASAVPFECKEKLENFCKVLTTGIMKSENEVAAIRLRERLLQDGAAFQASGAGRMDVVKLTQRAIKLFCTDQPVKRLVVPAEFVYSI